MAIKNHVDYCWPLARYNKLYAMLSSNITHATNDNGIGCKAVDTRVCVASPMHHDTSTLVRTVELRAFEVLRCLPQHA